MSDVSVVIPSYNSRRFIAATLDSILAQTDRPRQVIVIDDGSTDDGARIVQAYVDRANAAGSGSIELLRQSNAGESRARNVGIDHATARFVAFLDADDLWLPEKTARQLALLSETPAAVAVHTRVFNFHESLDDLGRPETERTRDDPSVEDLIDYHYICPSTLIVRREVLRERALCFDESVRHAEDMLFIADLRLAGPLRLVDGLLTAKRVHAGQQSKNPLHTVLTTRSRIDWCRKRAAALGKERAAAMEAALARKLVDWLERRYWRRDFEQFEEARTQVAELAPREFAGCAVAGRRIYPRWLYRLRDTIRPPAGN